MLTLLPLAVVFAMALGCARNRQLQSEPSASRGEIGIAAVALQKESGGPFFPPETLVDAVSIIRRIHREYPETRVVGLAPSGASELTWLQSLPFSIPDSLCLAATATNPATTEFIVDRWLNPWRTGNAAFDSVTDVLGGAKTYHLVCAQPSMSFFTLYYRQPVNIAGAARAYSKIRGFNISPLRYLETGREGLLIDTHNPDWIVSVTAGWGDCYPGCIYHHVWRFEYNRATRRIQVLTDSGPPVRAKLDG